MIIVPIDSNGYIIEYWIMGIQQYFSYIMEVSLNDVESLTFLLNFLTK
jgi:hypothetical protein